MTSTLIELLGLNIYFYDVEEFRVSLVLFKTLCAPITFYLSDFVTLGVWFTWALFETAVFCVVAVVFVLLRLLTAARIPGVYYWEIIFFCAVLTLADWVWSLLEIFWIEAEEFNEEDK